MTNMKDDVAPWIERFARVGYVAKAILYGTVGLLAAGAAIGRGQSTDSRGAMSKLLQAPFGQALLFIIALGLLGYGVWRCVSAVVDAERRGSDAKGLALRASFLVRGIAHLALAWSAARLAMGQSDAGGERSEDATSATMNLPGGIWILWIVAGGIAAFGVYQLYRAATSKLSKQLRQGEVREEVGGWVVAVSRVGIAARGLVFIAIGGLLGAAAADHDPAKAGGISDALSTLAQLGPFPYAAIGVGLISYGIYELLNSRYRRVVASG